MHQSRCQSGLVWAILCLRHQRPRKVKSQALTILDIEEAMTKHAGSFPLEVRLTFYFS